MKPVEQYTLCIVSACAKSVIIYNLEGIQEC